VVTAEAAAAVAAATGAGTNLDITLTIFGDGTQDQESFVPYAAHLNISRPHEPESSSMSGDPDAAFNPARCAVESILNRRKMASPLQYRETQDPARKRLIEREICDFK